jgi:hypothetical protein
LWRFAPSNLKKRAKARFLPYKLRKDARKSSNFALKKRKIRQVPQAPRAAVLALNSPLHLFFCPFPLLYWLEAALKVVRQAAADGLDAGLMRDFWENLTKEDMRMLRTEWEYDLDPASGILPGKSENT